MNGLYYYYRGNRVAVKRAARWGKDVYHMMRGKRWVCLALCLLTLLGTVQANSIVGNMVMDEEAYEAFRKKYKV